MDNQPDDIYGWEAAFSTARTASEDEADVSPDDEPWARYRGSEAPPSYVEAYLESLPDDQRSGRSRRSRGAR